MVGERLRLSYCVWSAVTTKIASYVRFETLGNFCCGKFVFFVKSVVFILRNTSSDCFAELAQKKFK